MALSAESLKMQSQTTFPLQILAADPGGSTGYAYASFDPRDEPLYTGGTFTKPDHHQDLRSLIVHYHRMDWRGPLHVVTESFDFRQASGSEKQRKGLELISRNYIGVMELVCQDLGIILHQQRPSQRNWVTDEKLQKVGVFTEPAHDNRHMHDAYRHLFTYAVSTLKIQEPITDKWMTYNYDS